MPTRNDGHGDLAESIAKSHRAGLSWQWLADAFEGKCSRDYVRQICLADDLRWKAGVPGLAIGVAKGVRDSGHRWEFEDLARQAYQLHWSVVRARRGGKA